MVHQFGISLGLIIIAKRNFNCRVKAARVKGFNQISARLNFFSAVNRKVVAVAGLKNKG